MKHLLVVVLMLLLSGCYPPPGHQSYIYFENSRIGKETASFKPFKFKNAGEFRRGDFVITGHGITHVDKNQNGDLVVHWDGQEILPNAALKGNAFAAPAKKEWVGKCLTYNIVDPKTHIIKSWGFDKGGNPLSCRDWH